jgi:acyl-CoA reductase-like NAD-dependent aldehyde dehydrogenase
VGAPVPVARGAQVGLAIAMAASYLDILPAYDFRTRVANSIVAREPAGVVAAITPWNVPLLLTLQKIVPALAAGCTVVLKPSEITPLNAYLLTEIIAECDLPPGVFNLVIGEGPTVGRELAGNPDVDLVSFTGSVRAGRDITQNAAESVKQVHLELGGKNASIMLDDADLPTAVAATVDQVCFNTGQTCLQWSRLLVPRQRHDEAVAMAAEAAGKYRVGPPTDPQSDLGPLVSAALAERVRGYIRSGIEQGAQVAAGGPDRPAEFDRGHYVRPTVFGNVDPTMTIAQEEIFGPVLSVVPYEDENDAVRIANGTRYGLHGAVWSGDADRALSVAARLRTGLVDINGGPFNVLAPFGGYKQSGVGRECGVPGLEGFLETKSMQLPEDSAELTGPRLRNVA